MKKILRFAVILLSVLCTVRVSAGDYKYLTLQNLNGEESSLTLSGLVLTFSDGNLHAKQNGTVRDYALARLAKMYLSKTATGVCSVDAKHTVVSLSGSTLNIKAPKGTQTSVFDAGGRIVFSSTIGADGIPAGVDVHTPGVYFVKAGSQTYKILVK